MTKRQLPAFTSIELTSPEDLGLLLGHQYLPQTTYPLKQGEQYCFVYQKFLYGIYKLLAAVHVKNNLGALKAGTYHSLKKTHNYRRLRLHHTTQHSRLKAKLDNPKLLYNLFRDENKHERKLYLKILDQDNHFLVSYAGEYVPAAVRHYYIRTDYHAIKELSAKILQQLLDVDITVAGFKRLQAQGIRLGKYLLHAELAHLLWYTHTVYTHYDAHLALSTVMIPPPAKVGKHFKPKPLALASVYLHTSALPADEDSSSSATQQLHSLGVYTSKEDFTMQNEIQFIAEKHRLEQHSPQKYNFATLEAAELLANIEQNDLVHLIYHGERLKEGFTIMRNNHPFLTFAQLKQIKKLPKVLILSMCMSDDQALIRWFFNGGGRSLITLYGDIAAETLPKIAKAIYWQIFTRRSTLRTAFQATMQNLYQSTNTTFYKLKLHGSGNEYFNAKENL